MSSRDRVIARHLLLFVVVFVILTAVAILLGLGPTVYSRTA